MDSPHSQNNSCVPLPLFILLVLFSDEKDFPSQIRRLALGSVYFCEVCVAEIACMIKRHFNMFHKARL